jgi:exonuclease III
MMILSFNARGVGGPQKTLSLKRLIISLKMDVILIQEIMCSEEKAKEIFSCWLKNWSFCTIDDEGMSRGIFTGWSPNFKALSSSSFPSSLSVNLRFKDNDSDFLVINIYGPYVDRVSY